MMKEIAKYSGIIVVLAGVVLLFINFRTNSNSNAFLISSALLIIVGFLAYVLVNRYVE